MFVYIWLVSKERKLLVIHAVTVLVSTGIMLLKFLAWYLTDSNAILTDALESIVNVLAGLFAWYSLRLSLKPRDHDHPYGHGKIEFISASLEGALILIAGVAIICKSIFNLIWPQEIHELYSGIWIIAGTGILNMVMGLALLKIETNTKSMTLRANGNHLLSDAVSSAGLVLGLGIIWITNIQWLDNILGIVFGSFIAWTALKILRKSVAGIMDEADFSLLEQLVIHLEENRKDSWIDIHNLRIIQYGSTLHIDCHVTLPWYYDLQKAHEEITALDRLISEKFEKVELFIHMDPCIPESCRVCGLENCEVRKSPFESRQIWSLDQLLKNRKHGLNS